jgi:FAD:protein FMN transferase
MMTPFQISFPAMTTRCDLLFYGIPAALGNDIAQQIERRVAELTQRYNFHSAQSWLTQTINQRVQNRVELDAEAAAILRLVHMHSQRTEGAFDISVGTYSKAVRQASSQAQAQAIRAAAAPYLGFAHWCIEGDGEGGVLCFDHPQTQFDLGGVIKEFAVDEAARLARTAGVQSGLINFGGDLYAIGRKPDDTRFIAAIPNPQRPEQLMFGLDLENQALTTSALCP